MRVLPFLLGDTNGAGGSGSVSVAKNDSLVGSQPRINLIEGSNITLTVTNDTGNNEVDVQIDASGSVGAPSTAQYLTLALDANLSAERVLVPGIGLKLTDAGANGNATLDFDFFNKLTDTSTGGATGDSIPFMDVSDANTPRRVLVSDFITNAGLVVTGDLSAYALTSHNHTGVYQPLATVLTNTTAAFTTAQETKLSGIEASATADQTGGEIKTAYEAELDTNAFDDAAVSKLAGIAASANNYSHPNHTGDVTSVADGATTIAANAVTLAKMAQMATASFLGRNTAATGDVEVLSAATALSILGVESGADVTDATNVAAAGAVMDGDFSSNGIMLRTAAGTYSILTDASANWNIAFGWGDHASGGYAASGHTHAGVYQPLATPLTELGALTLAAGDILYVNGAGNLTNLAKGANGEVLKLTAGLPAWAALAGGGDMLAANNLNDVASATDALSNLGLTANAKSLVTAADYAAMRGLLDLDAGTDFYSISAADAAFATAGHNHSGVYQPLATVLTNTTAAFTTAQETKLTNIETAADVTDATNVAAAGAAMLDTADQTVAGGVNVTVLDQGTKSTGTYTLDHGARPMQRITNGGAFTLAPDASEGSMVLHIVNNGSAGAITTSGWTLVDGDAFTTTNAHEFLCYCVTSNNGTGDKTAMTVKALQ